MIRFEIECGDSRKVIKAPTPHDAWMLFDGPANAPMARFREIPWNTEYSWTKQPKSGRPWFYVKPDWFLSNEARQTAQSEMFVAGDLKDEAPKKMIKPRSAS